MTPKTVEEFELLVDRMRAKGVTHLEIGDFKVSLSAAVPEDRSMAEPEVTAGPPEARNDATGLTPSEEKDLFYSAPG